MTGCGRSAPLWQSQSTAPTERSRSPVAHAPAIATTATPPRPEIAVQRRETSAELRGAGCVLCGVVLAAVGDTRRAGHAACGGRVVGAAACRRLALPCCTYVAREGAQDGDKTARFRGHPAPAVEAVPSELPGPRPAPVRRADDLREPDGCRGLAHRRASSGRARRLDPTSDAGGSEAIRSDPSRVRARRDGPSARAGRAIAAAAHAQALRRSARARALPDLRGASAPHDPRTDVSAWHSAMDPGNPTQRAHAYALLRCILGQAKEEGLLAGDNPCRIRGAGVFRREREIEPLSIPQLEVIGRPKSDAGVRKVAVPPHVVPALRAHLDSHVAHSLTRCFATLSGAHWTHGNFYKAAWIRHGRRPASPPSAPRSAAHLSRAGRSEGGNAWRAHGSSGAQHLCGASLPARCRRARCCHR